jgi:hypothetical protein
VANSPAKPKNPFFRRVKSLADVPGLTEEEINLALWGDKDGPKNAAQLRPLSTPPQQGGRRG